MGIYQFDPEPYPHFQFLCEHGARSGRKLCLAFYFFETIADPFLFNISECSNFKQPRFRSGRKLCLASYFFETIADPFQ